MTVNTKLEFDGVAPNNARLQQVLDQLAAQIGTQGGFAPGPTPAFLTSGLLTNFHYMGGFSANAPQTNNKGEFVYMAVADAVGWGQGFVWLNAAGDISSPSTVVVANQPFLMQDAVYAFNGTAYKSAGLALFQATGEAFNAGGLPTSYQITVQGNSGDVESFLLKEQNARPTLSIYNSGTISIALAAKNTEVLQVRDVNDSADRDLQVRYALITGNSAPADAALAAGQVAMWFDSTNGAAKLMLKGKQADGTVKTGSVNVQT